MDMRTYITSELAEEAEIGISSARAESPGYPGDPAVYVAEDAVTVSSNGLYYLARPTDDGDLPAVLVIHENKGLTEYVRNTTRRLALRGYVAVAPDLLASAGGTAAFEPAEATKALAAIPAEDIVALLKTVVTSVAGLAGVRADRLGIIGFCYGGGITWRMLTQDDRLRAGVPFYGPTPETDQVPNIGADTLAIYGETDKRITSMLPGIREAMAANAKSFEAIVYPGAGHAFHNDSNPDRYNAEAAARAWEAAVNFLDKNLKP